MQFEKSKVYFVSLGCPKNLVDSQVMLGRLESDAYSITRHAQEAEVIVVNTCSFIDAAKKESVDTILEMANFKNSGKCHTLVVSGCLPQRHSKELEDNIPEIDLMIGTGQYHRITEFLDQKKRAVLPQKAYINQPAFIHSEKDLRVLTGPKHTAYLKLSEGCNRRCSFCIIPHLRGNVRSRSMDSLVTEAQKLASQGVREINLVAQDLTHYGMETRYRENLEELLPRLCEVEGIEWIRLHYVYPDNFSEKLIGIIRDQPKIVKYLDMPIQHTQDRVLKLMNRRLTRARLFELITNLKKEIPEMVFRTSIIVGFPGETEEEFENLVNDLETLNLDHVGVFSYSQEEGTPAARLTNQLSEPVKRKRRKILISRLQELSWKKRKTLLGTRVPLMLEGTSSETDFLLRGRLSTQASEIDGEVLINDVAPDIDISHLTAGNFVEVEITDLLPVDYLATLHKAI